MTKAIRRPGFTLFEIMITVAIIVILASIFVAYLNPQDRLLDATTRVRIDQQRELRNALVQYYTQHHRYPDGLTTDETPVCAYGATNSNCVNLDVLIKEGLLDELPQDPEATPPDSGYLAQIEEDNDVKVSVLNAQMKISTSIPLVRISTIAPVSYDYDTAPLVPVAAIKQTKLLLPISNNLFQFEAGPVASGNTDIVSAGSITITEDIGPQDALISVSHNGAKSCQVLPPYSSIKCFLAGFTFNTGQIRVSTPLAISSPELGASNKLLTQFWQVGQLVDTNPEGNDFIKQILPDGNKLYIVADTPLGEAKLLLLEGGSLRQLTDTKFGGSDNTFLLGIFQGYLFFSALDNSDKYHIYKTDGNAVYQITNITSFTTGEEGVSGTTFKGEFYFTVQAGDDYMLFKTNGQKITQLTDTDTANAFAGEKEGWLYMIRHDPDNSIISRTDGNVVERIANTANIASSFFWKGDFYFQSNIGLEQLRISDRKRIPYGSLLGVAGDWIYYGSVPYNRTNGSVTENVTISLPPELLLPSLVTVNNVAFARANRLIPDPPFVETNLFRLENENLNLIGLAGVGIEVDAVTEDTVLYHAIANSGIFVHNGVDTFALPVSHGGGDVYLVHENSIYFTGVAGADNAALYRLQLIE